MEDAQTSGMAFSNHMSAAWTVPPLGREWRRCCYGICLRVHPPKGQVAGVGADGAEGEDEGKDARLAATIVPVAPHALPSEDLR